MNNLATRLANLPSDKRDLLLRTLRKEHHAPALHIARHRMQQAVPLSFAQERLWFLNQFEPDNTFYNIITALKLSGVLDHAALVRAFEEVIRRHEVLRTCFPASDGAPHQQVTALGDFQVRHFDLSSLPPSLREEEVRRHIGEEESQPFDLAAGPLIRIRLLRLGGGVRPEDSEHVLVLTMHHIVFDGWSIGILVNEFTALYEAFLTGRPSPLPELPIQYADYAVWQRQLLQGATLEKHLDYWRALLDGAPPLLELPTDHPRPPVQSFRGANYHFKLSRTVTGRILEIGQRNGSTLFMTLLAAFQLLLARYSGQSDISVGTPVANRIRTEVEGLIGFFVNTLVLRTDLSGNPTFTELLARVRKVCLGAQAHQDLPFEKLVEELRPPRDMSYSPLFQAMLVLQNAPVSELKVANVQLSSLNADTATAKFDLQLFVKEGDKALDCITEQDGGLDAVIEYATDLYEESTIARLAEHYQILLAGIAARPEARLSELPMLPEAERRRLLVEWNATHNDCADACLHRLFETQAEQTPDALALRFEQQTLTYRELDSRANQLARFLQRQGVAPGDIVGLCVERSLEMVVAVLGVLKAGCAYLPLEPDYPQERLRSMLDDAEPALLLTFARLDNSLPGHRPRIFLDRDWPRIAAESAACPAGQTGPGSLAYVIYTSGSTGVPKGVAVTHGGIAGYTRSIIERIQAAPGLQYALVSTFAADLGNTVLFPALASGGCLHLIGRDAATDGRLLADYVERHPIDVLKIVPAHLAGLLDSSGHGNIAPRRALICGGDVLPGALVERIAACRPECRILNHYGPTETTVGSLIYAITPETQNIAAQTAMPVGRPIANTRVYILDDSLEPAPTGAAGELYIGGNGLAQGYLKRPDLTAERFIPDPFGTGERLYRTGDRVRYRPDGNIEYLGRIDQQVKIRGYRIEPGEIRTRLLQYPHVNDAAVLAREDRSGGKRLVAYLTGPEAALETDALRRYLSGVLPDYMVPSAFVRLEALPLTANGKLDHRALPDPDFGTHLAGRYVAPRNETERRLAAIWAEVLDVERVGVHDNFFELGGHSLMAITLIERMRQKELPVGVRALFSTPTIAELAANAINGEPVIDVPPNRIPAQCDAITPEMLPLIALGQAEIGRIVEQVPGGAANVQDIYPLAPLQEGLLFHHLMNSDGDAYLHSSLLIFDTLKRQNSFLQALQSVIDRHDILRTAVIWEGLPEPAQVVWRHAPLPIEDVRFEPGQDAAEQLQTRFDPQRFRLDLRKAPLLRGVRAYDTTRDRWLLLLLFHHLAIDHITLEILLGELQAHLQGQGERLSAPLPFRSFVAQARLGLSVDEHENFFRKMLSDVEEPTAPYGLLDVRGNGAAIKEASLLLDMELAVRLRNCARVLGVNVACICHLAWAQVLARITGREDVVFGTVLFGRMQGYEGADRALGMFINTLPLRVNLSTDTIAEAIRRTHANLAELLRHEHASLALAQRCSGVPAPMPLFSALLNYRHSSQDTPDVSATVKVGEGIEILQGEVRTNYPFYLAVDDLGNRLRLTVKAQTPAEPRQVCEYMHITLSSLIEAAEMASETAVRSLEILPEPERRRLLVEWNATHNDCADACLHRLFETQAEQTPDALALRFEQQTLTYRELDSRANQLARFLQRQGVAPGDIVGLCVERSLEMVVAVLGVLKAGCAYLPLEPDYPQERLRSMLDDAEPALLLTFARLDNSLPGHRPRIFLDRDWPRIAAESAACPAGQTGPGSLAYVIYTSGSTGVPKGVAVTHGGIAGYTRSIIERIQAAPGLQYALVSTFAADLGNTVLFPALASGGCLHLIGRDAATDGRLLADYVERHPIDVLKIVPAHLAGLLDSSGHGNIAPRRALICGGDVLPGALVERIAACRPECRILNHYGPTETTVGSLIYAITPETQNIAAQTAMPVGRPIANTRVYILDDSLEPAPTGAAGELYIGGNGLAQGYLKRPDLTAERFIPDPFGTGERLYRTGDRVRYRPDGNIEYLGRIDQQVKIRGYRIEPGEIRTRLLQYPHVNDAAVLAREDRSGGKRLVAYLTGPEAALETDALRRYLSGVLPDYMVPSAFVRLEALPLTANGKLDHRALPDPDFGAHLAGRYVAPRNETERRLAAIWAEVLDVERVGVHDNFFELGGHSLMVTQLASRLRSGFDMELPLRTLFEAATVADLGALIDLAGLTRDSAMHALSSSLMEMEEGEL
ncbi:amino acid adenylation domain-containing protein [Candidatus Methylospira mobilis]|uniref:non-ribosomal peptide synthetase n=1 Tax=Candidatus Methylospira mobilis TaxID=1808979 RepID=UPI0028F01232|nr:non-ribosomal peptide synthetase [Candidatus Methylospira mobilis]WNV05995.1 amino acid adenylation domain-containing protein [Candidatus Methylospira mobilis]